MPNLKEQFLWQANFQLAWEKVADNKGGAGVDGETINQFAQHQEDYLKKLRQAIANNTYNPLPLHQLLIPKKEGSWRRLRVPTVRDRIAQQALLNVLYPIMEREFEPCSFAYRPGISYQMAVQQVAYWRDQRYDWVLDADIVQYFDHVQHSRLLAEVAERLDEPLFLALIQKWLSVGVLTKKGLILPEKGLPQGAVISPILANIYLDDFDEIISATDLKLVRYADDFLVLARSQKRIIQAQAQVAQLLSSWGLQLHPDKTCITNFDQGFHFLGQEFVKDKILLLKKPAERELLPTQDDLLPIHTDTLEPVVQLPKVSAIESDLQRTKRSLVVDSNNKRQKSISIASKETAWMTDMATIYLVEQGTTIKREHSRFLLQLPQEPDIEIPIREVERVLVFGNIQLTTTVISTCLEAQIPVVFLTQMGEYKGHLWGTSADLSVETAQFERRDDAAFKLQVTREIVRGKLWNSKQLLLRLNRKRQSLQVSEAIAGIDRDLQALCDRNQISTIDKVRGYEGVGAARYFPALGCLIVSSGFSLTERTRRPPKDIMNSLLSFGYTLLYNNVLSLLLAEGLNPYLGNLHGAEDQEAYLAFDMMEEFRSPIVDTLVMQLVNQKVLKPTDFDWTGEGGIYLTDTARRVFLKHFEERICVKVSHPDIKEQVSYRRAIQLQVQRYKQALLGNQPYEAFLRLN